MFAVFWIDEWSIAFGHHCLDVAHVFHNSLLSVSVRKCCTFRFRHPAGTGDTIIYSAILYSLIAWSGYAAWWCAVCMFLYFIDYMTTLSAPNHAVSRVDCLPFGLSDQNWSISLV